MSSTASDADGSESLSDIDDTEVAGYLNTKEATLFKRMIWEVMNKDYNTGKKRKRATKSKKAAPEKKVVKVSPTTDKKRLSSKINFDALKKLNEELGCAPGSEEAMESNSVSHSDMQQSNDEKKNSGGSHDDDDDELEHENAFSDEAEDIQGYDEDAYFANDEYNDYSYEEEYNFDEY